MLLLGLGISGSELTALAQPWSLARVPETSDAAQALKASGDVSRAPVIKLALGDARSCALHKDGQVSCWGKGQVGQPGGDAAISSSPVPVGIRGIVGAVQVAAGSDQACARTRQGQVLCWVDTRAGQATAIEGVIDPVEITSECARLRDGSVQCWGSSRKANELPGLANVAALATYQERGCAALKDGEVLCWSQEAPPQRIKGLAGVVELGVGEDFACARHKDGAVSCWGENKRGQLGRTTSDAPSSRIHRLFRPYPRITKYPPTRIAGLGNVVALSVGGWHACARKKDNTLLCWGQQKDKEAPGPVPSISPVWDFAVGTSHACAIKQEGTIACWGRTDYGELGMGWSRAQPQATRVPGIADAVRVYTAYQSTCAIRRSGAVTCWGDGDAAPRDVAGISGAVQLSGTVGICARDQQGHVRCNTRLKDPFREIAVPPATAVAANTGYACAIAQGGRVFCWGSNEAGVFGIGSRGGYQERPVPAMQGIGDAVTMCAAPFHTCMLRASGEVACVGRLNESDGRGLDIPLTVAGPFQATSLQCNLFAACAVRADGLVMCWRTWPGRGEHDSSVLTPTTTPRLVAGLTQVVQLSVQGETACARRLGGDVACWGQNTVGQVGDGTIGGVRSHPVTVANVAGAVDVSSCDSHSCAVLADGSVKCWGLTSNGQVGTHVTDSPLPPVEVLGLRGESP